MNKTAAGPRGRSAKIIATLGPGSSAPGTIRLLAEAGVDVFRLNFSHGEQAKHKQTYDIIRRTEEMLGRPLAVLADMQGPKIRVGKFPDGGLKLEMRGEYDLVVGQETTEANVIPGPRAEVLSVLEEGDTILADDGLLIFTVVAAGDKPRVRSELPGVLKDRKGFLIGDRAMIVAKLEKPAAIDNLEDIIDATDAVMIARGDLGVEFPPEEVPLIQRRIVRVSRNAAKPVIVATQMLESMVENAAPTRAEASDVATAVYQGVDAVMLSAETAVGRHPATAVAPWSAPTIIDRRWFSMMAAAKIAMMSTPPRKPSWKSRNAIKHHWPCGPGTSSVWRNSHVCVGGRRYCTGLWTKSACGRRNCCGAFTRPQWRLAMTGRGA